jgi:hypothetical protein
MDIEVDEVVKLPVHGTILRWLASGFFLFFLFFLSQMITILNDTE